MMFTDAETEFRSAFFKKNYFLKETRKKSLVDDEKYEKIEQNYQDAQINYYKDLMKNRHQDAKEMNDVSLNEYEKRNYDRFVEYQEKYIFGGNDETLKIAYSMMNKAMRYTAEKTLRNKGINPPAKTKAFSDADYIVERFLPKAKFAPRHYKANIVKNSVIASQKALEEIKSSNKSLLTEKAKQFVNCY